MLRTIYITTAGQVPALLVCIYAAFVRRLVSNTYVLFYIVITLYIVIIEVC